MNPGRHGRRGWMSIENSCVTYRRCTRNTTAICTKPHSKRSRRGIGGRRTVPESEEYPSLAFSRAGDDSGVHHLQGLLLLRGSVDCSSIGEGEMGGKVA